MGRKGFFVNSISPLCIDLAPQVRQGHWSLLQEPALGSREFASFANSPQGWKQSWETELPQSQSLPQPVAGSPARAPPLPRARAPSPSVRLHDGEPGCCSPCTCRTGWLWQSEMRRQLERLQFLCLKVAQMKNKQTNLVSFMFLLSVQKCSC